MHILVIGAGGMLGAKLVARLARDGRLGGLEIGKLTRHDVVLPPPPPQSGFAIDTFVSDLTGDGEAAKLVISRPDVIFHLGRLR